MIIKLKEKDGQPYLKLAAKTIIGNNVADDVLENFIRLSRKKGIKVVNESDFDHDNSYATIRIKD